jgi:trehalose 6-phosphate phosphatase
MAEELRDIEPIRPILAQRPLGILSDIDGTLAPIVENPAEARISARNHAALTALISAGVKVGLVTGRALEVARAIADLQGAIYATSHGLNIFDGETVEAPAALAEWVTRAREIVAASADLEATGVTVEDKGALVAFHYRRAPSEASAVLAIDSLVASGVAQGFRVLRGRKVVELRPPLDVDKGTAAHELVQRMEARAVVCMGDDETDVDMFHAVAAMRGKGLAAAIIGVESSEVSERLLAICDYYVLGVEGVERLLEEMLRALPGRAP